MQQRRPTTPPGRRAAVLSTLSALLLLTGCTLTGAGDAPDAPEPAPTSDAPAPPPVSTRITVGDLVVSIAAPDPDDVASSSVTSVPAPEGSRRLTFSVGSRGAVIALESPGALVRNDDGSVTVTDDRGTALGGFSAPRTDFGPAGRVTTSVLDPAHAEVRVVPSATTASPTSDEDAVDVTAWLGEQAIRSATWGTREGGRSLAVDPTAWARGSGIVGQDTAWAQLVAAEPKADLRTTHDQLTCHAIGAADKATWNLEPWRPDVGLLAMAAARCNPTASPS